MKLTKLMNNFHQLEEQHTDLFFSYETPIAFITDDFAFVSVNNWAQTTGKHINYVKRTYPQVEQIPHEDLLFRINLYNR